MSLKRKSLSGQVHGEHGSALVAVSVRCAIYTRMF